MSGKISFNNTPIVIDTWQRDNTYEGVYPSGSRVKDSYFSPSDPENQYIKSNWRYLFKLSRAKFPWQFWCEIIAYRLGTIMGIKVPPAHIGLSKNYKKDSETYAALIEWFYDDKKEGYIPGGLMMESRIKNFDRRKGEKHNFKTIREIFEDNESIVNESIVKYWANILTFDTLIGNLDRHQDNWGFIVRRTLTQAESDTFIRTSPAFDNGTALGYEILEQNIDRYKGEQLQHYLMHKKAKHHIKWSLDENEQLNFYDFMNKLVVDFSYIKPIISQHLNFDRTHIEEALYPLTNAVNNTEYKLTQTRLNFVISLILGRKKILEETLKL